MEQRKAVVYDSLLRAGVSEDNFLPVYYGESSQEIAGYQIVGKQLEPEVFTEGQPWIFCEGCGKKLGEKESNYYYGCFLDLSKVKKVDPIIRTGECFGEGEEMLLVTPEIAELMKQAAPRIALTPVFPLDSEFYRKYKKRCEQ